MIRFLLLSTTFLLINSSLTWSNPIISEFMAVNRSTIVDDDNDRNDWIELFNPSGTLINLQGWALTDDPKHQLKWTFPNINLRSSMSPGNFRRTSNKNFRRKTKYSLTYHINCKH